MATRTQPLDGVTLPTPCPVCRGRLRWHGAPAELRCDDCPLGPVTLSPADAWEIVKYLSMPSVQKVPLETFVVAVLATHHIYAVVAHPDPQVISTRDGEGWKLRVLPAGTETPAARMARLGEQAAINNVQVVPVNAALHEFRVSSQRRDSEGQPVCWYQVRMDDQIARCSCPAPNDAVCAHLSAVNAWLTEALHWERETGKAPVAYTNTGKYADLYDE